MIFAIVSDFGIKHPNLAERADAMAREAGVTVAAGGHQDVFRVNLESTVMGASQRIDSVTGSITWNPDDYGPVAADVVPIDLTVDQFAEFVESGEGPPELR